MAQFAGPALRDRWADWMRPPFTSYSTTHVSVFAVTRGRLPVSG